MPDQTKPENSQSRDPGNAGDKEKLFFGKYKTIEDAEQGYKEAERKMHDATQQASHWKEIAENSKKAPEYGEGGDYVPAEKPAPVADNSRSTQVLAKFYSDPEGTLNELEERAVSKAEKRILGKQQEANATRERVAKWAQDNPDMAKYGDLLDTYVRQTDGRLSPETRLDEAAKRVRVRLSELRGTPQGREPGPGDYVPGPSGNREEGDTARMGQGPSDDRSTDQESELKKLVASRNTTRMKRLGTHGR